MVEIMREMLADGSARVGCGMDAMPAEGALGAIEHSVATRLIVAGFARAWILPPTQASGLIEPAKRFQRIKEGAQRV
jgi:hypothetical protein